MKKSLVYAPKRRRDKDRERRRCHPPIGGLELVEDSRRREEREDTLACEMVVDPTLEASKGDAYASHELINWASNRLVWNINIYIYNTSCHRACVRTEWQRRGIRRSFG